ncbi:dNA mismatch repair protein MutS [Acholeplasma sp. CAG:878]|nr:dNA mismatch repair protein MutS [Acholeplasma sp. CAG:878]
MSKLYNRYKTLKNKEDIVYIFKVGMFYVILDDDAKILSKLLNLKLIPLNSEVNKCGFPVNSLKKYEKILKDNKIKYKIIEDYEENKDLNQFLNKIKKYDIDNMTGIKALELIYELKEIINGTR